MLNLKMIIRKSINNNFPSTVGDTDISEKIFSPTVSTLKEITTRKRTKVVVDDFIEIPRELIDNNQ